MPSPNKPGNCNRPDCDNMRPRVKKQNPHTGKMASWYPLYCNDPVCQEYARKRKGGSWRQAPMVIGTPRREVPSA